MTSGIKAAIVDTSAIICMIKGESAAADFAEELALVETLYMSAVTKAETMLVVFGLYGEGGFAPAQALLEQFRIQIVDFADADTGDYLRCAMEGHMKTNPPGKLNMGDLFSMQLAVKLDLPLFFQGMDFLTAPVSNAMHLLGYTMSEQNKGVPELQHSQD